MLYGADILVLVVDGFYKCPIPKQYLVVHVHKRVLHVLLNFRDKVYVIGKKCFEKFLDYVTLVFERLFYSGYVAMAKIRFTEFLPSAGCHHSVCPHYRHLARP